MATDERYVEVKDDKDTESVTVDSQSTSELPPTSTADYSYGFNQEQLEARAIRGISSGKTWTSGVVTRLGTAGTGNWSWTGVGFKPKMVQIRGIYASNPVGAWSEGHATEGQSGSCFFGWDTVCTFTTSAILDVRDNTGTTRQRATLVSMDADGFTLNFTTSAADARYIFTCIA